MSGTLVIRPGKLGDLVASTPAIGALRNAYRDEPLWVMADRSSGELLRHDPNVDRLVNVTWDERAAGQHTPWKEIRRLLSGPRFRRAAILYDHCPGFNLLCLTLGIPDVAQLGMTWPAPFLGHRCVLRRNYRDPKHYCEYYMSVAAEIGASPAADPMPRLYVADEEKAAVIKRFPDFASAHPRIIIHPFSASAFFNYSLDAYGKLSDALSNFFHVPVFMIGTAEEALKFGRLPASARSDLLGSLSLREVMAALGAAHGVVGGSSGIVHVAAALGTPTVGIFCPGFSHNVVWRPRGPRAACLTPAPDVCSDVRKCEAGRGHPQFCNLEFGISHEDVLRALSDLIR